MLKMNRKGEFSIAGFILLFVGAIVAIVLLQAAAQQTTNVVNTEYVRNATVTVPVALNATTTLRGQAATGMLIINATGGETISTGNYTVTNYNVTNGQLRSYVVFTAPAYNGSSVNLSYTSEPLGYAKEAGSRTMTNLIIILGALALAAFALSYVSKEYLD